MKVSFTSDKKGCILDTNELNPAQTRELEKLIKDSNITFDEPQFAPAVDFHTSKYGIVIEEDGKKKVTLYYEQQTLPAKVKPLVNFLKKQARPIK